MGGDFDSAPTSVYDWYDSEHHKFLSEDVGLLATVRANEQDGLSFRDLNHDRWTNTPIHQRLPFRRSLRIPSGNMCFFHGQHHFPPLWRLSLENKLFSTICHEPPVNASSCLEEAPPKFEDPTGVQPANFQIGQPVVRPVTGRLHDEDIKFVTVENEEASQESRHVEGHFPNNPKTPEGEMVRLIISPKVSSTRSEFIQLPSPPKHMCTLAEKPYFR